MANNNSFQSAVAHALGIDEQQVPEKLDGLSLSQANDLTNALSDNDTEKVRQILGTPDAATVQPVSPTNEAEEQYNIDEVVTVDKGKKGAFEATVSDTHGPNGSLVCTVEGKQRVVQRSRVSKGSLNEALLGAAELTGLLRMQVLAGLPINDQHMPLQIAKIRTVDVPGVPHSQAQQIATATEIDPEDHPGVLTDFDRSFLEIMAKLPENQQARAERAMVETVEKKAAVRPIQDPVEHFKKTVRESIDRRYQKPMSFLNSFSLSEARAGAAVMSRTRKCKGCKRLTVHNSAVGRIEGEKKPVWECNDCGAESLRTTPEKGESIG